MSIICLRPDLDQGRNALALYISGALPNAKPGDAYEAELQIHNQVGVCTILSVDGGPVPPGGGWFIRGDKLVLSWPAYSAAAAPINNANFELGDLTDWTVTKHGELSGYPTFATADSARPYSGSYSALWKGNEGLGHARGVEAVWENAARADVIPGHLITASAQIALDDTSTSQNRGRVQLVFFDENDDEILRREGTLIRGDNENYRLSEVPVYGPNGAKSAGVAVWTTANESPGSGVRFGAVEWDAPQVVGINVETTLCFNVTVRDSAGRTAQWSGCVVVFAYLRRNIIVGIPGSPYSVYMGNNVIGFDDTLHVFGPAYNGRIFWDEKTNRIFRKNFAVADFSDDYGQTWQSTAAFSGSFTDFNFINSTETYCWFVPNNSIPNVQRMHKATGVISAVPGIPNNSYSLAVLNDGTVLVVNGGLMRRSVDEGASWATETGSGSGFGGTYALVQSKEHVFTINQSNPTVWLRRTAPSVWSPVPGLPGEYNGVFTNWAHDGSGNVVVVLSTGKVWRSSDDGLTWAEVGDIGAAIAIDRRIQWSRGSFYVLTNDYRLLASADNGATWTLIHTYPSHINLTMIVAVPAAPGT